MLKAIRLGIVRRFPFPLQLRIQRRFVPRNVYAFIRQYFDNRHYLYDLSKLPRFLEEAKEAGIEIIPDPSVERRYHQFIDSRSVKFIFQKGYFRISVKSSLLDRKIQKILDEECDGYLRVKEPARLWHIERRLSRAEALISFDADFNRAFLGWGENRISIHPSVDFINQIVCYFNRSLISDEIASILRTYLDEFDLLSDPNQQSELTGELKKAKAKVYLDPENPLVSEKIRAISAEALALAGEKMSALYSYQERGVGFLLAMRRALLADDMGLGKTIQALAAASHLKEKGEIKRVLVICPASVKIQWQREAERWSDLKALVIEGDKESRLQLYKSEGDIHIINYELTYRDAEHIKGLKADLIILDEAQRIKNYRTKTSEVIMSLRPKCAFVLTGTPLENDLMELYNIMRFIDPEVLGRNPIAFRERYLVTDIFGQVKDYKNLKEVSRKISGVTLRRLKAEVLQELPELIENRYWLTFGDEQARIYRDIRSGAKEYLAKEDWSKVDFESVLTIVQRLREVCDTPELVFPDKYQDSCKMDELKIVLQEQVIASCKPILLFTQWTRMAEIIIRLLSELGINFSYLHGSLSPKAREKEVKEFMEGDRNIFLSTDAGALGLNLQKASTVVNFDLPFNPAKVAQRVSRAHRLGQKSVVNVINLVVRHSIEENLIRILDKRRKLFEEVLGEIEEPMQGRGIHRRREFFLELLG